ncbi:hypothetical protein B566_EDAN014785 [Ephemera danica]|nr:hypothetical protein B566_EDAN014785 [Ephemera danica]
MEFLKQAAYLGHFHYMGSLRVWRTLLQVRPKLFPSCCIMTSPTSAEKAMEKLKSNPFFDKYSKKIALVQQFTPEKLLACLNEEQNAASSQSHEHKCAASASSKAKIDINAAYSKPKNLSDVMKTDLLADKTANVIEQFLLPLPRSNGYEFIVCQIAGHEVHFTQLINYQNAREAQCLVNQFQLYYGQPDQRRLGMLERFTCSPADFKHMDLVAELEYLSL